MSVVRNFKRHKQIFHLVSFVLSDAITFFLKLHVARVLEKSCWRSILKNRLQECRIDRMWLENTVRQAAALSSNKRMVEWVFLHKLNDFLNPFLLQG